MTNDLSFYLEDCVKQHILFPKTFSIPTRKDILRLQIDDDVKLIFVIKNPEENGPTAERMWVYITEITDYEIQEKDGDNITNIKRRKFRGRLDDEPYFIQDIHYDDLIEFDDFSICQTNLPYDSTINLDDFCFISKEAVDQKNSEVAMRYPNPQFENDSGWRFYFGNNEEKEIFSKISCNNFDEFKKIEKNTDVIKMKVCEAIKIVRFLDSIIEEEEGIFLFSDKKSEFIKLKSFA